MAEKDLYEPVGEALIDHLKHHTASVSIENTSEHLTNDVRRNLDNIARAYRRIRQYRPDLVGLIWTDTDPTEHVQLVVEVKKGAPGLDAVKEVWLYQQLMEAKLGIVVGTEPMEPETVEVFRNRMLYVPREGQRLDVGVFNPDQGKFKEWVMNGPKGQLYDLVHP